MTESNAFSFTHAAVDDVEKELIQVGNSKSYLPSDISTKNVIDNFNLFSSVNSFNGSQETGYYPD